MISLTPDSTSLDTNHVMQVLALVSDPVASVGRLAELTEALNRANAGIDRAEKLQDDVDLRLKTATAAQANLDGDKATFAKLMADTDARHAATQQTLTQQRAELDASMAEAASEMKQREADVSMRETDIITREAAATAREADLATREVDLARRLKLIQSAAA